MTAQHDHEPIRLDKDQQARILSLVLNGEPLWPAVELVALGGAEGSLCGACLLNALHSATGSDFLEMLAIAQRERAYVHGSFDQFSAMDGECAPCQAADADPLLN